MGAMFGEMQHKANEIGKLLNAIQAMGNDNLGYVESEEKDKKVFKAIFDIIAMLQRCDFACVSREPLNRLSNVLNDIQKILEHASNFNNPNIMAPTIDDLERNYQELYEIAAKIISFDQVTKNPLEKTYKALEEIQQIRDELLAKVDNTIMKPFRERFAELGVSQNAVYFSKAEKKHRISASIWLGFAIVMVLILVFWILFGIWLSIEHIEHLSRYYYTVAGFVTITALLFYVLLFFRRNYESEKHNQIVNANKARILSTYQAFVDATNDEIVQENMLIQAGVAAFSIQNSGYSKAEAHSSQTLPTSPITAVTKEVVKDNAPF